MTGDAREEVTRLLAENRRLRELLTEHGIAWQPRDTMPTTDRSPRLGTDEKVKLFASLLRGREDVYPVRWESKAGKSGYSPACANEWRAGICEKPRIKCGDCAHRALIPVTGQTVFDHLAGRQPIIFMQCGPTRHTAEKPLGAPQTLEIVPRYLAPRVGAADDAPIQQVFQVIASDVARTAQVADEVTAAFAAGGKVLVLTERTEHLDALRQALGTRVAPLLVLHGRMSTKQRTALLQERESLPADAPWVLLSTGKLVGEGFDHAPLDTLVLAMPISWKGTLAQYADRLHREHASKNSVRIVDFVDEGHPALLRMWERRQRG